MNAEYVFATPPPAAQRPPEARLLDLLLEMDAPLDPADLMQRILDAVIDVIPCDQAFLYEWDEHAGQPQLCWSASTDPVFLQEYLARFRSIDPFATESVQLRSIQSGRSLLSSEILSPEALIHTPFHTRFLSRHGNLRHGLGLYLPSSLHYRSRLWLFRSASQPAFSREERDCLDTFGLHVSAKLRRQRNLVRAERERDAMVACMDAWNQPVFVLDVDNRVINCNAIARALVRENRRLGMQGDQLIPGRLMDHASWIAPAVVEMRDAASRSNQPASRCVPLPTRRSGAVRHFGLLASLSPADAGIDGAATLLTLIDLQQPLPRHRTLDLCRMFGFTHTESRVANALIAGLGTDDISQTFLIRRDTVRTHVKRLLGKTGTHSHAELQKLLLRISPNLVALSQKPE